MEKKVVRSLYTMEPACLVCRSSEYLTQGCGGLSLSHRWSLIRPHPVRRGKGSAVAYLSHRWSLIRLHPVRRGKGSKCIISPFDGAEAARPDLRYTPFSLTKLRCGRAYATYCPCRLPAQETVRRRGSVWRSSPDHRTICRRISRSGYISFRQSGIQNEYSRHSGNTSCMGRQTRCP